MNKFSDPRLADYRHIQNVDEIQQRLKEEFGRGCNEQIIADVITIYLDGLREKIIKCGVVFIPFIGRIIAVDFSEYSDAQLAEYEKRQSGLSGMFDRDRLEHESPCAFLTVDGDDKKTVDSYMRDRGFKDRMADQARFRSGEVDADEE